MRILLEDGFSIEKGTGIGRYTQNLASELDRQGGVEVLAVQLAGKVLGVPADS